MNEPCTTFHSFDAYFVNSLLAMLPIQTAIICDATQKFPKFLCRSLTSYRNFFSPHPLWTSPLWHWYSDSSRISTIGSNSGRNYTSASSSHSAVWPGSLQFHHNVTPWASISSSGIRKIWRNPVSREGGWWPSDCRLCRSEKLLHTERCMSQSVVMIQGPGVVAPSGRLRRLFSLSRLRMSQ